MLLYTYGRLEPKKKKPPQLRKIFLHALILLHFQNQSNIILPYRERISKLFSKKLSHQNSFGSHNYPSREYVLFRMLNNSSQALYLHIQNLVQALNNKKSSNNAKNELVSLIDTVGVEAEKYTLSCLLEIMDFKDSKNQTAKKEQLKVQFLTQRLSICTDSPAFMDYFAEVIESYSQKHNFVECINDLTKNLKLTLPVQIIMAFSLSQSQNQQIAKEGITLLKKKIAEYCRTGKSFTFSENIFNDLLYLIRTTSHFENMKKEVQFLVESNSAGRSNQLKPLLSAAPENPEPETQAFGMNDAVPPNPIKVWEIMKDLGPTCTHSPEFIERILSDFPSLNEDEILETLLLMSNNSTCLEDRVSRAINHTYHAIKTHDWSNLLSDSNTKEANTTWKVHNFLEVCNKKYRIDWSKVIAALDRPNLDFKDPQALITLFKSFQRFKKVPGFKFPSAIFFGRWKNPISQIEFLSNVIRAGQPEQVFFTELPKRTVSLELYPRLNSSSQEPKTSALQFFTSIEILEILIELSESDSWNEIRGLFDLPLEENPDHLLLNLLEARPRLGFELLNELYTTLILRYLANHTNSQHIFEAVWKSQPRILISAFSEIYTTNTIDVSITTMLDIIQSIPNALPAVLNSENYSFTLALAFEAAKRGLVNLEDWLSERVRTVKNEFTTAFLKHLRNNVFDVLKTAQIGQATEILEKAQLPLDLLLKLLRLLIDATPESISQKNRITSADLYKDLLIHFPDIEAKAPPAGVEVTANNMIEKIFEGSLPVPDFISALSGYKNSENEKEKEVAVCIISNLLDESRFFSTYKPKMLMMMAQIYSALIKNDIIEGKTRDLAFFIILDSVKQKESRKLFEFGVNALLIFKERLYEWPTKAVQLFSVENLRIYSFDLLEQIQSDLTANNVEVELPEEYTTYANSRGQKTVPDGETNTDASSSTDANTIPPSTPLSPRQLTLEDILNGFEKEHAGQISEEVRNKIAAAVNSSVDANLFQKAIEIKAQLKEDIVVCWFARYIISQKAPKEPNKHEIHISLVEKVGRKEIFNILTKETYLLFSYVLANVFNSPEKSVLNGKDKNILKNLGSWLGLLTIARNKPIIMKEFDIKSLLVAAHENKKLDHILPLICKILIQGEKQGSVFKPNNAWMNAILSILAEIAEMQDIKMALKYEIQMLFRNLGLNDGDITPSKIFQARKLRKKNAPQPQNHTPGSIEAYLNSEDLIKYLKSNISIPKNLLPEVDLKTISAQALSAAIRRTLPNVSDASTLALITSKRLVLKDFAMEPDEKNLVHGLELTIQSLAENITLVASQRPLTEYFQQSLEESLSKYTFENKEKIIEATITNNLDLGCAVIRNAVVKEALGEAIHDQEVMQAIEKRKLAKEKGASHYDENSSQIWSTLPEVLKPNPRGLTKEEMKIYEGFRNGSSKKSADEA